ncbi:unnamed protein product [Closterium sp. NIES-54]
MFDLLHELDTLVQPDNPCHPSTWLSLLALHLGASDLPHHLRPLALLTAVLAAHPSCPSARIAARVAISFAQSSHPNLCQRLGIQGLAWLAEETPSLIGEDRREKESRFGPKQQEGQIGENSSDGSFGGGEEARGGKWATEGSKGMDEEDWEGFKEVEWGEEEGMEGVGRGEVVRAVRGAVGALRARREAVLQELAAVEGQLGEVVSDMMLRGGGICRFAARLEGVGEGGGEGKWEGDGEKGETQDHRQVIENSGLLLSREGGRGEAEGGGGAAGQVLTPDLASAVAESLGRVRAWGQQWRKEQQMLSDVGRLLDALEGMGGMGAMGELRTSWGRGRGGGVGVEGSEGDEGKGGEGRGGEAVVAGAEEGSSADGVSDGGECYSSEGEEGPVFAAGAVAGDDAHGSGSQRAARRKKSAWRPTTEEDIIRAASLLAVRASQHVHHMVDDRLLSATLHDLTALERHDNVFIQYKVAQSTHQLFHEIICKSEVNEDEHALLHLRSKSLQVLSDGLEGCGGDDPRDIEQVKELLSPLKPERSNNGSSVTSPSRPTASPAADNSHLQQQQQQQYQQQPMYGMPLSNQPVHATTAATSSTAATAIAASAATTAAAAVTGSSSQPGQQSNFVPTGPYQYQGAYQPANLQQRVNAAVLSLNRMFPTPMSIDGSSYQRGQMPQGSDGSNNFSFGPAGEGQQTLQGSQVPSLY